MDTSAQAVDGDGSKAGSLRRLLWSDCKRCAALAAFGCLVMGVVDFAATISAYPADVRLATALRLALLATSLLTLFWVVASAALATVAMGTRLVMATGWRQRARSWPGLFPTNLARSPAPNQLAAWLWAVAIAVLLYLVASSLLTYKLAPRFKEPVLTALLLATLQVAIIAAVAAVALVAGLLLRRLGRLLDPHLGAFNPLARVAPALALLFVLAVPLVSVVLSYVHGLRDLVPWRHLLALAAFAGGAYLGTVYLRRRGTLLPARGRPRLIAALATGAGALLLLYVTLTRVGADPETKYMAITSSPTLSRLIDLVRKANDFDGDGYGSLLGENDCGPFNRQIHPGARDIPDNDVDENCDGRDFSFATLPSYRRGEKLPVPAAYLRDWNFLLITIDTVRYDHTSFGGYIEKKDRDTTPELAKLVERSTSFTFANAPSAGTMASVPAIVTSKFFHSGIALDEKRKRGDPPILRPSNTLISEVMKRDDYRTGAILSHEYFNNWGMEQGFDTYDNELGKKRNPKRITSHDITDRIVTWIARNNQRKWFLWAHYIDPHGYYMAHPGEVSYGTTEEDLYDGELHYTDKHLGRLFTELARMPGADRTIIIITSDHGDGFMEHGFINHAQALYKEILHVPLIVYIPNLEPRAVDGAVSPLDILPTMADLSGIDVSDLSFEGESLVPQLFYGRDAHERVVFAETNIPEPQRAAVTSKYKLIFKLKSNIYELYDLTADPWEHKNVAARNKEAAAEMKGYLNDWLERVFYSRDIDSNQATSKLKDHLLTDAPTPRYPLRGLSFDDGRIEVVGYDLPKTNFAAGEKIPIAVYFHVVERPGQDFRIQVEGWLDGGEPEEAPKSPIRSKLRLTGGGLLPTSRWRDGEYIRDRFRLTIPRKWSGGDTITIGIRMASTKRDRLPPKGEIRAGVPDLAILGKVTFQPAAEPIPAPSPRKPAQHRLRPGRTP